jgi:hypothetical protein
VWTNPGFAISQKAGGRAQGNDVRPPRLLGSTTEVNYSSEYGARIACRHDPGLAQRASTHAALTVIFFSAFWRRRRAPRSSRLQRYTESPKPAHGFPQVSRKMKRLEIAPTVH